VRVVLKALITLIREAMRGWRKGRVTIKWCYTNLFQELWNLKNELILTPEELIKFNNLKESGFHHTSILDPALVDRIECSRIQVWGGQVAPQVCL